LPLAVDHSTCYVHSQRSGLVAERNNSPVGEGGIRNEEHAWTGVDALPRHLDSSVGASSERRSRTRKSASRLWSTAASRAAQRHGWNDTYTMTKWLGEQLLFDAFGHTGRLSIVRPDIVERTLCSPVGT